MLRTLCTKECKGRADNNSFTGSNEAICGTRHVYAVP